MLLIVSFTQTRTLLNFVQEKCDQMTEYIKRLRRCIRSFQELEGNYLFEHDKLKNLLELAEKKYNDMGT